MSFRHVVISLMKYCSYDRGWYYVWEWAKCPQRIMKQIYDVLDWPIAVKVAGHTGAIFWVRMQEEQMISPVTLWRIYIASIWPLCYYNISDKFKNRHSLVPIPEIFDDIWALFCPWFCPSFWYLDTSSVLFLCLILKILIHRREYMREYSIFKIWQYRSKPCSTVHWAVFRSEEVSSVWLLEEGIQLKQ